MRRTRRTFFATLAVAILIAAALSPAAAEGPLPGSYSTSVSPDTVQIGSTDPLTFTISNNFVPDSTTLLNGATITLSGFTGSAAAVTSQPIGAGCTASLAGNVVIIDCETGVAPTLSVSVQVSGTATAVPGPYTQTTTASSDLGTFTRSGKDPVLTVVDIYATCGAAPCVTDPVTEEVTNDDGTTKSKTTVTMSVPGGAIPVKYDLSVGGLFAGPSCDAFAGQASTIRSNVVPTVEADLGRPHVIDVTIHKVKPHLVQNGVDQWGICFASDKGWTAANGPAAGPDSDGFYTGILRTCSATVPAPCLEYKKRNSGNVIMRYHAPAGDPLGIPGTGTL